MEHVFSFLQMLQSMYIFEILLIAAGLLILADYLFPTDAPAHLGYLCIALAVFFRVSGSFFFPSLNQLFINVGIAIATWIGLGILHRLVLRRFLENAPGTEGYETPEMDAE